MDKILEYIQKIIKKTGDKQAYYVFSVEHRSTFDKPFYLVTISWTKKDQAVTRFAEYTKAELLAELKKYYRTQKADAQAIRYHKNQIIAAESVIKFHKETLAGYEKPTTKKKKSKK